MPRPRREGFEYDDWGRAYRLIPCVACGQEHRVRKDSNPNRCRSCQPRGEANHNWKGGRFELKGYIWININLPGVRPFAPMAQRHGGGQYIMEHRLVMAQYLGRCLRSDEWVHHLNGKKNDNRIENLELVERKYHRLSYKDAFDDGYKAGITLRDKSLEKQIKLLQWQIKELHEMLKLKMELYP